MAVAREQILNSGTSFGGCARLLEHYKRIGLALLTQEKKLSRRFYGVVVPTKECEEEFAGLVAFIGCEVLESFLDDLLDLKVNDESLFISRSNSTGGAALWLTGLMIPIALAATYGPQDSTRLVIPICIGSLILLAVAGILMTIPRIKIMRRFGFATLLSHEISRRRGHDRPNTPRIASRLLISEMLSGRELATGRFSSDAWSAEPLAKYFH